MRSGRRPRAGIALLVALGVGACGSSADEPDAIRAIATSEQERRQLPSLSIAVYRAGRLVVDEAIGFADLTARAPATRDTVYQLGSISKQFLAAAVMRLVERGTVDLDAPITSYLTDGPATWNGIRVHHLLQQTSGLREYFTLPEFQRSNGDLSRTAGELVAMIAAEPLGFEPGERWSYSNSNYTLLASMVERITGQPYEEVLDQELATPLGLESLHHCPSRASSPRYATGYGLDGGTTRPSPPENMSWARGDGGLCANARDLAVWVRALARGEAVSEDSYRSMTTALPTADGIVPDYGFGLSLVPLDGQVPRIAHHGAMAGFTGMVSYYPQADLAIAVLVNRGGVAAAAIENRFARALLGLPPFEAPAADAEPETSDESHRVAGSELQGTWDIGIASFPVRIAESARGWRLEMPPPGLSDDLIQLDTELFAAASEPDAYQVRFEPGVEGRPDRLRLLMAGMHWYGRRAADPVSIEAAAPVVD